MVDLYITLDDIEISDKSENQPRFLGKTPKQMVKDVLEGYFVTVTVEDPNEPDDLERVNAKLRKRGLPELEK